MHNPVPVARLGAIGLPARLLAEGGVAREGVGVGVEAVVRGDAVTDGDDGAPLGELGAELDVLREAVAQAVEPLGDGLTFGSGEGLGAHVDLDAGVDPLGGEQVREACAVGGGLAQGFVVKNGAADALS